MRFVLLPAMIPAGNVSFTELVFPAGTDVVFFLFLFSVLADWGYWGIRVRA